MPQIRHMLLYLMMVCLICALTGCGKEDPAQELPNENIGMDIGSTGMEKTDDAIQSDMVNGESDNEGVEGTDKEEKILTAYFSRADENYGVGYIEKGDTAVIAEIISEETGGELFHIQRETPYPASYDECTEEAKQEQSDNARPALLEDKDISKYDVIFLGFPIWWGEMPMPVYTFLEGHDFSGKTVIPFCTHAGSGLSGTEKSIEAVCTDAEILDGLSIKGEDVQNSRDKAKETVKDWLKGLSY